MPAKIGGKKGDRDWGANVITIQPNPENDEAMSGADLQNYFSELHYKDAVKWTSETVVAKILEPLNFHKYSKSFIDHKIEGIVLINLDEHDLKELHIDSLGDRRMLLGALSGLRQTKFIEKDKVIWEGAYPPVGLGLCSGVQYYNTLSECIKYKICCCFMSTTYYTINRSKIVVDAKPSCVDHCIRCSDLSSEEFPFRDMKDMNNSRQPQLCCFCYVMVVEMKFGGKDPLLLRHPGLDTDRQNQIRTAWGKERLIANRE